MKRELNTLVIPPNTSLFTYDAVSMYTNSKIDNCIEQISNFLSTIWDRVECAAVTSAMDIVMRNNRIRGSSPSLPANIYFFGWETYFFEGPKPPKKQTDAKRREATFLT
jgi:hypothetical protein